MAYIDTYIERDVAEEIRLSNLSQFKKFIQFCAIYSGQMLNMESISREIGVSANTIKSWLSILENSFIIHLLETDTNNLGRSIVKTPKLYFVDVGLLCYLLRIDSKEELLFTACLDYYKRIGNDYTVNNIDFVENIILI